MSAHYTIQPPFLVFMKWFCTREDTHQSAQPWILGNLSNLQKAQNALLFSVDFRQLEYARSYQYSETIKTNSSALEKSEHWTYSPSFFPSLEKLGAGFLFSYLLVLSLAVGLWHVFVSSDNNICSQGTSGNYYMPGLIRAP